MTSPPTSPRQNPVTSRGCRGHRHGSRSHVCLFAPSWSPLLLPDSARASPGVKTRAVLDVAWRNGEPMMAAILSSGRAKPSGGAFAAGVMPGLAPRTVAEGVPAAHLPPNGDALVFETVAGEATAKGADVTTACFQQAAARPIRRRDLHAGGRDALPRQAFEVRITQATLADSRGANPLKAEARATVAACPGQLVVGSIATWFASGTVDGSFEALIAGRYAVRTLVAGDARVARVADHLSAAE